MAGWRPPPPRSGGRCCIARQLWLYNNFFSRRRLFVAARGRIATEFSRLSGTGLAMTSCRTEAWLPRRASSSAGS